MSDKPTLLPKFCCISQCSNYKNPQANIDLYPLPDDILQRMKCCEILNIPIDVGMNATSRICANHFKSKKGANKPLSSDLRVTYSVPPTTDYRVSNSLSQTAQTAAQGSGSKPLAVFIDDGRRLNYRPNLPIIQSTTFPTPSQQAPTLQLVPALQQPPTLQLTPTLQLPPSYQLTHSALQQQSITLTVSPIMPTVPLNQTIVDTSTDTDKKIVNDLLEKDKNSCNSDVTLQLECEEDILSSTQLNSYMKDLMDFVNASELVHRLPAPERSSLLTSNVSEAEETLQNPPLDPLFKNISTISSPTTLSITNPNSQLVYTVPPSTKGIAVVSNPLSLLKNSVNMLPSVETTTVSSAYSMPLFSHSQVLTPGTTVSSQASTSKPLFVHSPAFTPRTIVSSSASSSTPLFVHSPVLTPRTVSNTVTDKNPSFVSKSGRHVGSSSFGANLSSNGFVSQCGQISKVATVNYSAAGSSPQPQSVTSTSLPGSCGSVLQDLASLANSSSSHKQAKSVFQIPEKFKLVNAVPSTNSIVPMMLLKALQSNEGGQSVTNNPSSASNSPVTIVGREPDETDTFAASLCDVTLNEPADQILINLNQTTSSNDLSTVLNQTTEGGSSPDKAVGIEVEAPVYGDVNNEIGPVIVDVISAKEGATEFFNANTIPNILLEKSKLAEDSGNASPASQVEIDAGTNADKLVVQTGTKMYSVNTKDSIFSIQKSIPVISRGTERCSETVEMFKIKTPMPGRRKEDVDTLRERLRQENFITWAVWWLIQRRYMPVIQPCNFCSSKKFIVDRNDNFPDGFCWTCANPDCPVQKPIKRPAFFERFKEYSLQELLLLTFHWACQSSFDEITQDVDMDCDKIWCYFKALQELCREVSTKKGKLGIAFSSMVEVSVLKLGSVFILGAMDRKTRYVRLEAFTETEAYQTSRHIYTLEKWLNKFSTVITENQLPDNCLKNNRKVAADPSISESNSTAPHTLNISKYLSRNMAAIFGSLDQYALKINIIQGFLYELQWRVKYGKFVDMSFWSIFNHIRDLNKDEASPVLVKRGAFAVESSSMEANNALTFRWGPTLEAIEKNTTVQDQDQTFKLSGKDTKFYSHERNTSSTEYIQPYGIQDLIQDKTPKLPSRETKLYRHLTNVSVSHYLHDIYEIPGGSSMVTSKALLAVKIRFGESLADTDFYKSDAISLGLKLKSEGFISDPVKWLVKKGFVKNVSSCYVCQGVAFLRESSRFNDGCSWICQNDTCQFENVFKRPSFFARFPQYSMPHIAGMIFHWIVQSDESLINTDVPMDSSKIVDAWRAFQGLCTSAIRRKKEKIGGDKHIVEVSVVKFGRLYILGAMDRNSKRTLLQAFPSTLKRNDALYDTLHSWILPKSTICISATKNFKMGYNYGDYKIILANANIIDKRHHGGHVLNVRGYLIKHISNMFCHIKADVMRIEILQSYLEELMWREKYGKEPQQAFAYMMNEIFYKDLQYRSEFSRETKDPEFIPVTFKELRVVLRKIPKSVLKFYGCDFPNSSKTSEDPDSAFSEIDEKQPSKFELDVADDAVSDSEQSSESDDDVMIIDPEISPGDILEDKEIITLDDLSPAETLTASESTSSSTISALSESAPHKVQPLVIKMHKKQKKFKSYLKSELEKVKKQEFEKGVNNSVSDIPNTAVRTHYQKPKYTTKETEDIASSDSSHSDESETESSDSSVSSEEIPRKRSTRHSSSVEKEVESMSLASNSLHFNKRETQFKDSIISSNKVSRKRFAAPANFVKEEEIWETQSNDSTISTNKVTRKRLAAPASLVLKEETWETQSNDSTSSSNKKVTRKRLAALASSMQKEERPSCIECGEPVGTSFEHFMKQFNCTDCKKKSVYTTCCSKSFFEHRGSILFGKRMPRRKKEDYGLHRPVLLPHPWHCACGFNTNNGNKLASHMLKCGKRTCYYHQNVL